MEDPSRKAALDEIKWSLGYRGMCRFRSGTIFLQPVLKNFEYAMTLDTDGYFLQKSVLIPLRRCMRASMSILGHICCQIYLSSTTLLGPFFDVHEDERH